MCMYKIKTIRETKKRREISQNLPVFAAQEEVKEKQQTSVRVCSCVVFIFVDVVLLL